METFLIYIGKAALAAAAFYMLYLALFQHQKHFTFNRIYLPVSLALSFLIPLITFTSNRTIEATPIESNGFAYLGESTQAVVVPAFQIQWFHYALGIYLLGIAGFLFYLVLGHSKAISIINKSRLQKLFDVKVNVTLRDVHPFSFFSKIVLSEKTLTNPDLGMIVQHEEIHVRGKHTLDILFVEILFLFQWFNPFAWLLKDAIKNNLEYLTDHEVVKNNNPQAYQLAMLELVHKQSVAPFMTALNGSQLKNRIIMMKKKTENKYSLLKQLVVLPLLAVLVMGLSNKEVKTEFVQGDNPSIINSERTITGKITDNDGHPISGASIIVKGKDKVTISGASIIVEGKNMGTISDSQGNYQLKLNDENETLVFVMVGFETVERKVGSDTKINVRLNAEKKDTDEEIVIMSVGQKRLKRTGSVVPTVSKLSNKDNLPLYVVDGIEKANIDNLNPEAIESISVLKGPSGTKLYGEKGKNGVILIKTKVEGSKVKYKVEMGENIKSGDKEPLLILDGEKADVDDINEINPEDIASVSVLKGGLADEKYGEEGKDGVIMITSKGNKITSEMELRKFIAREIAYPKNAVENNLEGTVKLFVRFNQDGSVANILKEMKPDADIVNVDEVVVTAYKKVGESKLSDKSNSNDALEAEAKRVIEKFPLVDIHRFKGKIVQVNIKFILQ